MFTEEMINKFRSYKTPFYYYDMALLDRIVSSVASIAKRYGYFLHYAVKANANKRILKLISGYGLGADCVSGNEITRAVACGFHPGNILFAGVGKTDEEIRQGIEYDISCFNCESVEELQVLHQLAKESGKIIRIALRINPDVNAHTHKYITTGMQENKFGINVRELGEVTEKLKHLDALRLTGLHFHIGSQIRDLQVFRNLCNRVNEMQQWFSERNIPIEHINVGGGLGVDYSNPDHCHPDMGAFFNLFNQFIEIRPGQTLHFEPGRALVAGCGDIITRVLYVKKALKTRFIVVDAGMTELIRPALYQAYHKIENLSKTKHRQAEEELSYDVVGPICESSDCFGKALVLPATERGDLLAIRTAGAYGETMASSYNLRSRAHVIFSDRME